MPHSIQNNSNNNNLLLEQAAAELESMKCLPAHNKEAPFPLAARALLYSLPGNQACVDCGAPHPQWASVSFGALLCLQCSGMHRGFGVKTSFVRSVDMDAWSHAQILGMLEGGNSQLQQFFARHRMDQGDKRYHTKAGHFYRTNLAKHVQDVAEAGVYQGREAARQRARSRSPGPSVRTTTKAAPHKDVPNPPSQQPQRQQSIVVQ